MRSGYWRRNLVCVGVLLAVWAFVSFGCSILLADFLNRWRLPGTGFRLGFWFAQQGSIIVFVLLIFVYTQVMNRLDRDLVRETMSGVHANGADGGTDGVGEADGVGGADGGGGA